MLRKLKAKSDRAGRLVNALLDYQYSDAKDEDEQEYINEHRYEEKV